MIKTDVTGDDNDDQTFFTTFLTFVLLAGPTATCIQIGKMLRHHPPHELFAAEDAERSVSSGSDCADDDESDVNLSNSGSDSQGTEGSSVARLAGIITDRKNAELSRVEKGAAAAATSCATDPPRNSLLGRPSVDKDPHRTQLHTAQAGII
jgi:hypothetical protein